MRYIVLQANNITPNQYRKLLDFVFLYSQYFSICTFKSNHKKDLSDEYESFLRIFEKYRENENNFYLPKHYTKGQQFKVYALNADTKKFISGIPSIFDWKPPKLPENLSFFQGKKVWFSSITHENLIILETTDFNVLSRIDELKIKYREDI